MILFNRWRGSSLLATGTVALSGLVASCTAGPDLEAEAELLLGLHERLLEAHRNGDVDSWMALEADDYISANGGTITFPSLTDRRSARDRYLSTTTFTVYRDLRPPIVRLSADATLGWLIAEVEVRGLQVSDTAERAVEGIWAWIELYEKQNDTWRLVGNVSNRRP